MPFLIDGHNLIPKIPGLSLQDMDDEQQLITLLLEFCRLQRKQIEVFFDNAPPGGVRARNFGNVIARFVKQGSSADQAIHQRLERLWAGGSQLGRGQLRSGGADRSPCIPGAGALIRRLFRNAACRAG